MAAALHAHACRFHGFQCFHINSRRRKKRLAQRSPQHVIISIQAFLRHLKDFSHKGKTVGVHARTGNTDQHIARGDIRSGDHILFIHDPHRETCKIILLLRHQIRVLRRLSADQRGLRLHAAFRHSLYYRCDLFGKVFPAGNIIQEKQRFPARAGNIVDAHRHTVDPDRIMPLQHKSQLQFCAHAVRS